MKQETIKSELVYIFVHAPAIYSNIKGQFFRTSDDKPIPTTYQNGRIAVRDKNKFYGIKRLRLNAVKTTRVE